MDERVDRRGPAQYESGLGFSFGCTCTLMTTYLQEIIHYAALFTTLSNHMLIRIILEPTLLV